MISPPASPLSAATAFGKGHFSKSTNNCLLIVYGTYLRKVGAKTGYYFRNIVAKINNLFRKFDPKAILF